VVHNIYIYIYIEDTELFTSYVEFFSKKQLQDTETCTDTLTPSQPNTNGIITKDNKPVTLDVNIKIGIIKTDEATPSASNNTSQSFSYSDAQVETRVDTVNNNKSTT